MAVISSELGEAMGGWGQHTLSVKSDINVLGFASHADTKIRILSHFHMP